MLPFLSQFGIPLILHLAPVSQDSGKSRGGGSSSSTSSAAFIVSAGGGGGGPAVGSCSESQRWRCYALGQRPLSFYDRVLPVWVMSSLTALSSIAAAASQRPPVKFDLFSGDPQLPELPKGSRLSCPGITTIRAVAEFVVHRIEVGGDLSLGGDGDGVGATSVDAHAHADSNPPNASASAPTAPPEEAVEILLDTSAPLTAVGGPHAAPGEHGISLSFGSDLQTVRQFLYGARASGDQSVMMLRFRRRQKKAVDGQ